MDTIAVLDFGGQYSHLIANRIRRLSVYSEIVPCDIAAADLERFTGLIFSGGPHSVLDPGTPTIDPAVLELGKPILGLCYGHQLIAKLLGGRLSRGIAREYGLARLQIVADSPLFTGLSDTEQIWMSHGDAVEELPPGFASLGTTGDCSSAAVGNEAKRIYGLQFHPEVTDTPNGMTVLENFLDICGCRREWNSETFMLEIRDEIRQTCGDRKVFLLVSGGVDSTVAFALLNEVLGPDRVQGLHVDTGMMRLDESADIMVYMRDHGFDNLEIVDASDAFLEALAGISEPEAKRNIIGNKFIEVQKQAQADLGLNIEEWVLGQGTIYPDTIESAGTEHADRIKTHHNRVDVILELMQKGLVIEPLAQLYKDEVRLLGEALGLPHHLVWRHPFPGPGLGVRLLCSDGEEAPVAEETAAAVRTMAAAAGYDGFVLPVKSVGVQGDGRSYAHPALVAGPRDWDALQELSTRLTNSVKGINRVVYGLRLSNPDDYRLIEGYMTRDRLDVLRRIDHVATEALFAGDEYHRIWQMPVVLLPLVNRDNNECCVLRPMTSQEAMTARFAPLARETFDAILNADVPGIGDIFFDITHKPPGTIEWE